MAEGWGGLDGSAPIFGQYATDDPPPCPHLVKAASALLTALKEFVEYEEAAARSGWTTWTGSKWIWNDRVWKQNDLDGFERVERARAAIAKAEGRQ